LCKIRLLLVLRCL
nr:immunoglobulin heavy chain junction region [Mus musculus]